MSFCWFITALVFIISLVLIKSGVASVTTGDALKILQHCSLLRRPVKERVMAGEKSTPDDTHSSRVIRVVFLALLLDLLGFTVILPLLPSILDHYSQTGVSFLFLFFRLILLLLPLREYLVGVGTNV